MRYRTTVTGQAGTGNKHASVAGWSVPGYTGLKALGSGGFGDVVLARHDASGTTVAIKYMRREFLADPQWAGLFRAEAQVLAALDDPNIVRLYEYVECPSGAAIVMELVDGVSVRQILARQGATTPEAALVVLLGSLLGLAGAHRRGIVHRDYKPENVLVNGGGVSKLTDFGIAVRTGDQPHAAGTIAYAAPEQMGGGPATPAADVYAATATFYECLTGRPPFTGETTERVMYQHLFEPVPLEPVPVPLRPLVEAGMAKEPERRPTDGTTFVAALRAVAGVYGPDWEERGRSHLGEAALLLAALWPAGVAPAVQGSAVQHVPLTQQGTKESAHLRHLWHLKHLRHLAHLQRLHPVRAILAVGAGAALVVAAGLYAGNLSFNTSAPPHPRPAITQSVPVSTTPPPSPFAAPEVTGSSPAPRPTAGGKHPQNRDVNRDVKRHVNRDVKRHVGAPPRPPVFPTSSPTHPAHPTPPPPERPVITGITPDDGPMTGGTQVSITGSGLANASTVSFGGAARAITSDSGSRITVTSPPGQGVVRVTVTTRGGTATGTFTYNFKISLPTPTPVVTVSPAPVIFAVYPRSGPTGVGTPVTITGENLSGATVSFGGTDGSVSADTSTQITVTSPADTSAGPVDITVATAGGTVSAGTFTYVAPPPPPPTPPTITSISPASATQSTTITVYIYGTNLSGATSVSFGSEGSGTITSVSSTVIEVTAPEFCGTVNITVATPAGTATSPGQFSEGCVYGVEVQGAG